MAQKFLTDIEVTRGLVDSSGDLGAAGQVLSSTGSGTNWITNEANSTVVYLDEFTGDNSTVDFTISVSVTDENITQVYIDGVYQNKDTYSVSNTTLTFSTAPPLNADIEVITFSTATTSDDLAAGSVVIPVKNTHTASIAKGEPVYITGNVGSSARLQIAPADASNSAKMPAAGLLLQTLAVNAEGYVITGGYLRNITTDIIDGTSTSSNDTVYVKSGGGLTMTKPTGSNLIQNIAKVARSSGGSSGSLLVSSILRTNDIPNLTTGKIWVGDGNTVESTVVHLDESNQRLGIGTSSPATTLHVDGGDLRVRDSGNVALQIVSSTSANSAIQFGDDGDTNDGRIVYENTGDNMLFYTNDAEKMLIDSAGNVGIGTSSPQRELHLHTSSSGGSFIAFTNDTTGQTSTDGAIVGIDSSEDLRILQYENKPIRFSTNGSERMRIDSSGNVGIGTTSPSEILQTNKNSAGNIVGGYFTNSQANTGAESVSLAFGLNRSGGDFVRQVKAITFGAEQQWTGTPSTVDGYLAFSTVSNETVSERMRIDSSGNILVSKTAANSSIVGNQFMTDGSANSTVNGDTVARFNRLTSDGEIIRLQKDTSTVGSIGSTTSYLSGSLGIGTTSPSQKLHIASGHIRIDSGYALLWDDSHERIEQSDGHLEFFINNGQAMTLNTNGLGIGTTSPIGKTDIFVGASGYTNNITTLPVGTWSFANGSGTSSYPTLVSKSNATGAGMTLLAATDNGAPNGMDFNIREGDNTDFSTLTTSGFTFSRFGTTLMTILRNGNVGIGTTSPDAQLEIEGTTEKTYLNVDGIAGNAGIGSTQGAMVKFYNNGDGHTVKIQNNNSSRTDATVFSVWTQTNSRFLIRNDGNVGIGTTTPDALLELEKEVNNGLGPDLAIYNKAYNSSSFSRIRMGRHTSRHASIKSIATTNGGRNVDLVFESKRGDGGDDSTFSENMRILSSGGITFNGDTAAANALDDYEEGTWTPDVHGSTTRGTPSYQYRSGSYTKIGNRVWCRFGFKLSSISGATGRVRVDGLPFVSRSYGSYQEPNFSVSTGLLATTANAYRARMFVVNSSSYLEGRISVNTDTIWNISDFSGDEWIILAFHYETHI